MGDKWTGEDYFSTVKARLAKDERSNNLKHDIFVDLFPQIYNPEISSSNELSVGSRCPSVSLLDLEGNKVELNSLWNNKPVLINFGKTFVLIN